MDGGRYFLFTSTLIIMLHKLRRFLQLYLITRLDFHTMKAILSDTGVSNRIRYTNCTGEKKEKKNVSDAFHSDGCRTIFPFCINFNHYITSLRRFPQLHLITRRIFPNLRGILADIGVFNRVRD